MRAGALFNAVVRQFGRPSGLAGRLAGLVMATRQSNRERNHRTVELLDIGPDDHVLEIGFGPGLALRAAACRAVRGRVVGIDHSEVMLDQARRRNARALAEGRMELRLGAAEALLPAIRGHFDKVLAVNVYMFLGNPLAFLGAIRATMKPGGRIALTFQPRQRGANDEDARRGGARIAHDLTRAGFDDVRIELLPMRPVSAVCVLGQSPVTSTAAAPPFSEQ